MKRSLLLVFIVIINVVNTNAQVTSISVETFYTDNGTVAGYPANHTTYRIYANCTNAEDRVTSIFGNADAPLILNVAGGIWNHPAGGVLGTSANCSIYGVLPAVQYDSYVTFDYTCNAPNLNTIYSVEDPMQPWKTQAFGTSPYGSVNTILNSTIGGAWFSLPNVADDAGDNTRAGADLKVLLAQITVANNSSICGILNLQCFPNYQSVQDNYIEQTGLQFGNIDCGTPGCTNNAALNYNPAADFDNGLCLLPCGLQFVTEIVEPTCSYTNDGSISFEGTGNQDFILYSFNGDVIGLLPEEQENLGNGSYTLTMHDTRFDNENMNPGGIYGNCTVNQVVEFNTAAIMLGNPTSEQLSCYNSGDGCADLTGYSGGTGDLTFNIYSNMNMEVVGGLAGPGYCGLDGGMFYYKAIDENGCEQTSTMFEVDEPNPITLFEGAELPASCFNSPDATQVFNFFGGTGDIDFELDGNGDYEIEGNALNLVLTNLVPGSYTLYAQDANFCVGSTTFNVSGGPVITISPTITNPLCNGDTNGSITINAAGGSGGFTYSFDGVNYGASNTMSGYGAGTETVYVKDQNGCIAEADVTLESPEVLTATADATDVLCNGDNNGTILINASGGSPIYLFSIDGITYTPSPLFQNLSPSTYEIYVQDGNGCQYNNSAAAVVGEPAVLTANAMPTDVTCNGADNGQILVMVSGGTSPYQYSAGGAPGNTNPITGLDPDIYDVVVIDANGCEFTVNNVEITEPAQLNINGLTPDPIDETPGGNSTYTVTGGTTPYSFQWVYNGNVVSTGMDLGDITNASDAGAYTLTVTDANGCTESQTINITGTDELDFVYQISIFPNPSNGQFLLSISGVQGEKMAYTLTDETGRIVLAKEMGNVIGQRTETVEASGCAAGIYYMQITVGDNNHTAKVIIQ